MGQYFIIVNLDKKEYIHPHDLNRGAKLLEFSSDKFIADLMTFLDFDRWAKDKVVILGDYDDFTLFKQVNLGFRNISKEAYNEYVRAKV